MRISSFNIYDRITRGFQENLKKLFISQEKIASGKKINRPSDDVIGMSKVSDYKLHINKNEQYRRNIDEAIVHLSVTESTMDSVIDNLNRAYELALTGINGDENAESRAAIAKEVQELYDQMLNFGNSRFRDKYIFSGYKTDTKTFDNNEIYQGDNGRTELLIDRDVKMAINFTGDTAFSFHLSEEIVVDDSEGANVANAVNTTANGATFETYRVEFIAGSPVDYEIYNNDTGVLVASGTYTSGAPISFTDGTNNIDITIADDLGAASPGPKVGDTFYIAPGGDNLNVTFFESLDLLKRGLNNNDVPVSTLAMGTFGYAISSANNIRTEIGAKMNALDSHIDRNEDNVLSWKSTLSHIEDADITETFSEFTRIEVALQALRNTGAKILSQSLFDFLR